MPDDPTTPAAGEALTAESERLVRSLAGPPFNVVPPWLRLQLAAIEAAAAARALAARPGSADSVLTRLLRDYAAQARGNDSGKAMVPAVVLSDAAQVIDDYRPDPCICAVRGPGGSHPNIDCPQRISAALAARPVEARVVLDWLWEHAGNGHSIRAFAWNTDSQRLGYLRCTRDDGHLPIEPQFAAPDPATTPVGDTDRNTGDGSSTAVWYTPDCGHQHLATDPTTVDMLHCPTPREDRGCVWRPAYRTDECGLPEDHKAHHPERGIAGWYVHPYCAPPTPPAPAGRAEADRG